MSKLNCQRYVMIAFWSFCLVLCALLQLSWARGKENSVRIFNTTKNKMDGQWVNTNTYSVEPQGTIWILYQDIDFDYASHKKYHVKNVGREALSTYIRYGNMLAWVDQSENITAYPGKMVELVPGQEYAYSELIVTNDKNMRGYAQCFVGNSFTRRKWSMNFWNFDLDMNNLMKKLVVFGADYIPHVGTVVSNVIDFFWPATAVDAWEEIKNEVTILVDKSISDLVEDILENKIRMFKKKLQTLALEQTLGVRKLRVKDHYLNIAQDMIGIEEEFRFRKHTSNNFQQMNYATLPLFSLVISMKLLFYRCGFENPDALGLDEADIKELQVYALATLNPDIGIIQKHFQEVLEWKIQHAYDTVNPENLFNEMTNIKNYVAYNAEQYVEVWKDLINGSPANGKPYSSLLYYPSYIGTPTADLLSLGGGLPLLRTLTPPLDSNGRRPLIRMVDVHTFNDNVVGIDVIYDDESVLSSGMREGTEIDLFIISPDYLQKLEVWGDFPGGIIRGLNFITDGDSTFFKGTTTDTVYTFEMSGHHIAGIHISNDMALETTQAWNVAVSFQPDNTNKD